MPINHKRRKKERKRRQIQKQRQERALNRYICKELKRFGQGNMEMARQRILDELNSGRCTIPDKYFRNDRK